MQEVINTSVQKPAVLRRVVPTSLWEFHKAVSASAIALVDLLCIGSVE